MTAYYNEIDPFAAAWLRELIKAGHIAPGDVDERSIEDVTPDDLRSYTQAHFFAGIGVWSHALRRAGWPDDRPVWTGSCPCQPFSAAGQGGGFADERHLWPAFHHLIRERRPPVVLGEQVASKDGLAWLDLVSTDMEATGYSGGAVDLCAAGVGAPHIRQRQWFVWMANTEHSFGRAFDLDRENGRDRQDGGRKEAHGELGARGKVCGLANAGMQQPEQPARTRARPDDPERRRAPSEPSGRSDVGGMADADGRDTRAERQQPGGEQRQQQQADGSTGFWLADAMPAGRAERRAGARDGQTSGLRATGGMANPDDEGSQGWAGVPERSLECAARAGRLVDGQSATGPTDSFWRNVDWLFCRDGKWRPVEPRPQSVAYGVAEDLGRVCDQSVRELEEDVAEWSIRHTLDPGETLHDLWRALSESAKRERTPGRLPSLHSAAFLLTFLRQLQRQGWAFAERVSGEGEETPKTDLRVLRHLGTLACTPCERGLDRQSDGERSDPVRVLSSILARHAQTTWGFAHEAHAAIGFPLAHGARARVGRLRGYGNAINAEAARVFIEAVLETEADAVRLNPSRMTTDRSLFE